MMGLLGILLSSRSVAVLALCQIAAGCVCSGPRAAIAKNRRPSVAILGLSWAIFVWGRLGCLGFATVISGFFARQRGVTMAFRSLLPYFPLPLFTASLN